MIRSRRESLEDKYHGEDHMAVVDNDDNAAPDMQSEPEGEKEDPLVLAMEDLMGRIVTAIDDVKTHPGVRSSPDGSTVHDELATMLRPVLEVAAHTGPSVARTYYSAPGPEGVEASCEEMYEKIVSDLVLPFILEFAQADPIPAKRAAALEFFHCLYKECRKQGSWLDNSGPNAGPYGTGGGNVTHANTPAMRAQQKRRHLKRMTRESEILRYWVQASIYCTLPGAFTSSVAEDAVASRGVIAASASLRPSLRHICQKIQDADDRGALKLYGPVMKMIEGVLNKLFSEDVGDGLRSAAIKFLEIVTVCCSSKGPDPQTDRRRRGQNSTKDFSLDDLPAGHPVITREALETISDYSFHTLRGLLLMGGQVKPDEVLDDSSDVGPHANVVAILKRAYLAFLAIESGAQIDESELGLDINRGNLDYRFLLSQKPYALTINAMSVLAVNRPGFYKEATAAVARRAADPPKEGSALSTKASVLAVASHLRATCLTLLRNALSITTHGHVLLQKALEAHDMKIQSDKAVAMAKQTAALKTAGRAARNRAAMFYQWDASEDKTTKRKREADDALAKIRAAKAARGLGHGIQLPSNMVDAIELVMVNLQNLPSSRPLGASKNRGRPVTLDYVVDAVMTNGASLSHDEGRWYERDGGSCWSMHADDEIEYKLDEKTLLAAEIEHDKKKAETVDKKFVKEMPKLFSSQCHSAASQAIQRILQTTSKSNDKGMVDFGNKVAAKLAWTLVSVEPSHDMKSSKEAASESVHRVVKRVEIAGVDESDLQGFIDSYPLVSACLTNDFAPASEGSSEALRPPTSASLSLANTILNEAYLESCEGRDSSNYEKALGVYSASVVFASNQANEKPNDSDKKRIATLAGASMTQQMAVLPQVTPSSLSFLGGLCDVSEITKKATEASRRGNPQQPIAAAAAINAGKMAAEKRALAALVTLRDIAFQRSNSETRLNAIKTAVAIATGRIASSPSIEEKALKLCVNVINVKSDSHSKMLLEAAVQELERASAFSIENHDRIVAANKVAAKAAEQAKKQGLVQSEEEKKALEGLRKPAMLYVALCVRKPELLKELFALCSVKKSDFLARAAQETFPKFAKSVAALHGDAAIALQVAAMSDNNETSMLLAFLDNLAPTGERALPSEDLIKACHQIQDSKLLNGKKDPRFIIPVVTGMKRVDLVAKLHEFVAAEDKIFMAALVHMASRLPRHALVFREEDEENPVLTGMTLCEQLVFLHKMDFQAQGIAQKRYLDAIRLCLDDDQVFTDTVVQEALNYISGTFLAEEVNLPLAYMRTIILTCSKHESLHNWICHILLPRLIEGKVYTDRRQWEGWMRCARMLENTGVDGIHDAINKLPADQLQAYRTKYPQV